MTPPRPEALASALRIPLEERRAFAKRVGHEGPIPDLAWIDRDGSGFGHLWLVVGDELAYVGRASAYRRDDYTGAEDHSFTATLMSHDDGAYSVVVIAVEDVHYGPRTEQTFVYTAAAGERAFRRVDEAPVGELIGEISRG